MPNKTSNIDSSFKDLKFHFQLIPNRMIYSWHFCWDALVVSRRRRTKNFLPHSLTRWNQPLLDHVLGRGGGGGDECSSPVREVLKIFEMKANKVSERKFLIEFNWTFHLWYAELCVKQFAWGFSSKLYSASSAFHHTTTTWTHIANWKFSISFLHILNAEACVH